MIRGFIFDMDGVIIDNHIYHYQAWFQLCEQIGHPITEDYYRDHFNGKKSEDILRMLDPNLTEDDVQKLMNQKEELYRKNYGPFQKSARGLINFIQGLKANNYKLAIGTSAPVENVLFTIDGLKLRHYFDVMIDGSMVSLGKPNPEVYQKCIEGLNLRPEECVVFEDAPSGLVAAKSAGAHRIGVVTSHKKEELVQAERFIDDFEGLDAETIQGWFKRP